MTTTIPQTRKHLEWEVGEMVARLTARDLTDSELVAMAEALRPAHARIMEIPSGTRPILRIIPDLTGMDLPAVNGTSSA